MIKLLFLILEEVRIFFKTKSGVFWVIVFPSASLLVLGVVFGSFASAKTKIGVINASNSSETIALYMFYVENLRVFKNLKITTVQYNKYRALLDNRELDIAIIMNSNIINSSVDTYYPDKLLPEKDIPVKNIRIIYDPAKLKEIFYGLMTVKSYTRAFAETVDTKTIPTISTKIEEINANTEKVGYIDFLISGIITMAILSITIFSVGIKFSYMKASGFLKRLSIVPFSRSYYIIANIISYLLIIVIVTIILLTEAHYIFNITLPARTIQWWGFLILGSLTLLSMSFLFPTFTRSGDQADIAGQILFFLMMFLGNSYFPTKNMPKLLQYSTLLLPNTYFNDGLRRLHFSSLYQYKPLLTDAIILSLGFFAFTSIAILKFRWVDDR